MGVSRWKSRSKDEDIYSAIEREIDEELDCKVETKKKYLMKIHMNMIHLSLHLISIKCTIVEGTPTPREHSKLIWLKRENLGSLKWAPADIPAVEAINP